MAVIPIWPGSSSFAAVSSSYYVSGTLPPPTPFGFYDNDPDFKTDANKVANFCALRLGYPIENIELQDINFWAGFEEAVTVYGNELYAFSKLQKPWATPGGIFTAIPDPADISITTF
jgi:hypothetical protein